MQAPDGSDFREIGSRQTESAQTESREIESRQTQTTEKESKKLLKILRKAGKGMTRTKFRISACKNRLDEAVVLDEMSR